MTKTRSLTLCEETDYLLSDLSWQARFIFAAPKLQIRKTLLFLGVDFFSFPGRAGAFAGGRGRSFWEIYEHSLHDILRTAHKAWKMKVKRCMELQQRASGRTLMRQQQKVLVLNLAWERVKKLFAEHNILL